ncbi:MAG: glycosyltransferase [Candidatus Omnitrophica bacterium]|nr:glycosyltransferase [Candidatus Omnitrophota bacterium]MBU0881294.1 glycosyltransferase [Candidatus Omnitrophota bacterium]MBU1808971.1 glycosyltransferase [Candidatus Omnitrophota bacterium]
MMKLSILMPVRNEGVNIRIMLKILKAVIDVPHEVLIVYDDANDDAIPAVNAIQGDYPAARLVHNTLGRGVNNAITSGIAVSRGEYILLFAVDEVGPVLAIEDMMALMLEGCDMVSCTRYAYGGRRLGGSFVGGILSRTANSLFRILSGASFTDGTTGIKMFKKELFDRLSMESGAVGWAVVFEMAIKAQMAGAKFGEVPIVSIDRLYGGKSTFSLGPWFKEYLRWFFWGVTHLRRSNKGGKSIVRIPQNIAG